MPARPDLAHALAALIVGEEARSIQQALDGGYVEWDYTAGSWSSWQVGASGTMDMGRTNATTPAEAWARLASAQVIPADWLDAPQRRFAWKTRCLYCTVSASFEVGYAAPKRCSLCGSSDRLITEQGPYPASINDCVAFASDVSGMLAAEAHVGTTEGVVWHMVTRSQLLASARRDPAALYELGYAFDPNAIANVGVVIAAPGLLLQPGTEPQ